MNVLVIDDDVHDYHSIRTMLGFAGYNAELVTNTQEAIAMLQDGLAVDLVISNIIVEGLNGFHFCRAVKKDRALAHLPVILLAPANAVDGDTDLAERAGASALLRKPLQRDRLLTAIDQAVLRAPMEANALASRSDHEEMAFHRDHNAWLNQMMYQTSKSLKKSEALLSLREAHLYAVHSVVMALGGSLDLSEIADTLVRKTAELSSAQIVAIYDHDGSNYFILRQCSGFGVPTPSLAAQCKIDEDSPMAEIYDLDHGLLFVDPDQAGYLQSVFELEAPPASGIASPLVANQRLSGFVLALRLDEQAPYTDEDAEILFSLAGAGGLALRNAHLYQDVELAYSELKDLDRRKSEFVATTSHELRTPIAIMLGYASMLQDLEDDPKKKKQLAAITKQAHFLTGMVDVLLNLQELQEDQQPFLLRCTPIQFDAMLAEALQITERQSNVRRDVTVELDCDPIEISGDEVRLILSFTNLLDNAIKFSEDGGQVRVVVAPSPMGGIIVTVEDQGIGIAEEHFKEIFQPFYQVESSLVRRYGGLGLGLAIARGIIEMHGGTIEVKSKLGAGTRVIVTLPDAPPPERCKQY